MKKGERKASHPDHLWVSRHPLVNIGEESFEVSSVGYDMYAPSCGVEPGAAGDSKRRPSLRRP